MAKTFSGNTTPNREIGSRGYQGPCGVDEERLGRARARTTSRRGRGVITTGHNMPGWKQGQRGWKQRPSRPAGAASLLIRRGGRAVRAAPPWLRRGGNPLVLAPVGAAQPMRVVDLGAGTGILTGALARLGADVVAVEPDQAMLAELRRQLPGVRAVAGRAEALPLPDQGVDAVLCGKAIHWSTWTGRCRRSPGCWRLAACWPGCGT